MKIPHQKKGVHESKCKKQTELSLYQDDLSVLFVLTL